MNVFKVLGFKCDGVFLFVILYINSWGLQMFHDWSLGASVAPSCGRKKRKTSDVGIIRFKGKAASSQVVQDSPSSQRS